MHFKFQDDLLNKFFLVRVDCKSAKDVLFKDVENLASKELLKIVENIIFGVS